MEGGQLVWLLSVIICTVNWVESTQLWYSLILVLVLYWNGVRTLFSILKAILHLLRRFLMSLPTPPSCLTVLPRQVNPSDVGRFSLFIQHHFCLRLADLQAYMLCKQAEAGGFLLHVLMSE